MVPLCRSWGPYTLYNTPLPVIDEKKKNKQYIQGWVTHADHVIIPQILYVVKRQREESVLCYGIGQGNLAYVLLVQSPFVFISLFQSRSLPIFPSPVRLWQSKKGIGGGKSIFRGELMLTLLPLVIFQQVFGCAIASTRPPLDTTDLAARTQR